MAGLSYSIVHNYIGKVAHGKPMGESIMFLGGVAANQGVVAAFENLLGKEVLVPENHDVAATEIIQRLDQYRIGLTDEPSISKILKFASPYIDSSLGGEAVLSVGKTVDFAKKGATGIINVMPFNCMPCTIVAAMLRNVHKDNGGIPFLTLPYEGLKETNSQTRIEAFMHQARGYLEKSQSSIPGRNICPM